MRRPRFIDTSADPAALGVDSLQHGLAIAPGGTKQLPDANLQPLVHALGRPDSCRLGGEVHLR